MNNKIKILFGFMFLGLVGRSVAPPEPLQETGVQNLPDAEELGVENPQPEVQDPPALRPSDTAEEILRKYEDLIVALGSIPTAKWTEVYLAEDIELSELLRHDAVPFSHEKSAKNTIKMWILNLNASLAVFAPPGSGELHLVYRKNDILQQFDFSYHGPGAKEILSEFIKRSIYAREALDSNCLDLLSENQLSQVESDMKEATSCKTRLKIIFSFRASFSAKEQNGYKEILEMLFPNLKQSNDLDHLHKMTKGILEFGPRFNVYVSDDKKTYFFEVVPGKVLLQTCDANFISTTELGTILLTDKFKNTGQTFHVLYKHEVSYVTRRFRFPRYDKFRNSFMEQDRHDPNAWTMVIIKSEESGEKEYSAGENYPLDAFPTYFEPAEEHQEELRNVD